MSIWLRSGVANTRRIAPTRATLRTTAFRLAVIVRSMRCGPTRPHLKQWRRSRITLPSIRTVSTRSAEQRSWRRPAGTSGFPQIKNHTPPLASARPLRAPQRLRRLTEGADESAAHPLPIAEAGEVRDAVARPPGG